MLYPTMGDLLKKVKNRYLLVNLTAKRAREIAELADDMGMPLNEKPVTLAINEIAAGQISASIKED